MIKGKVKWFNNDKGFGFIESKGKEYFVHFSAIKATGYKTLKEGQLVTFTTIITPKGMAADNVELDNA